MFSMWIKSTFRLGSDAGSNISYDGMSERDRRVFLSQICGVVSEHTKKVCTKTIKCPQHTDEQKKYVRDLYLDNFESSLENLQVSSKEKEKRKQFLISAKS